jgi:hypothetical protein
MTGHKPARQVKRKTVMCRRKQMEPYRYCVAFRISHPNIDPSEITSQLGIEPSSAWKVGDPIVGKNGEFKEGVRNESFWRYQPHKEFRLHSSDQYLEDYLEKISTEQLKRHKEYFSELVKSGGEINFFIGLFSEYSIGTNFTASLLKQLGELYIDLQLDIYVYEEKNT